MEKVNVLWYRNGLRLHDNGSLHNATKNTEVSLLSIPFVCKPGWRYGLDWKAGLRDCPVTFQNSREETELKTFVVFKPQTATIVFQII